MFDERLKSELFIEVLWATKFNSFLRNRKNSEGHFRRIRTNLFVSFANTKHGVSDLNFITNTIATEALCNVQASSFDFIGFGVVFVKSATGRALDGE